MDTLGVYRVIGAATQLVGHLSMSDGSFAYDSSGQKAKGIAEGMASERADASYRRPVQRLIDDGIVTEQLAAKYAPSNMQGSAKQS